MSQAPSLRDYVDETSKETEKGKGVSTQRMDILVKIQKKGSQQTIKPATLTGAQGGVSNHGEKEGNLVKRNKHVERTKLRKERKEPRSKTPDREIAEDDTGFLACLWNLLPWNYESKKGNEAAGWSNGNIMVTRTFDLESEITLSRPESDVNNWDSMWPVVNPCSVHHLKQEELETSE